MQLDNPIMVLLTPLPWLDGRLFYYLTAQDGFDFPDFPSRGAARSF